MLLENCISLKKKSGRGKNVDEVSYLKNDIATVIIYSKIHRRSLLLVNYNDLDHMIL